MPHRPGHLSPQEQLDAFTVGQEDRVSPQDQLDRFTKQGQAEEVIERQGSAPEGLVEGTRGDRFTGPLGSLGKRLLQPPVNIPFVTPAIQKGLDVGARPLEAFAESTFRTLTGKGPVITEPTLNPLDVIRRQSEEFRERPFLQQLGVGLLDPAVAIARAPSALGTLTRSVPADPFLRAATPATQTVAETLGTRGTTAAVSRMRLAQTGQRAGTGFQGVPASAVPPTTPRILDVPTPPTQRAGGLNLAEQITPPTRPVESTVSNFREGSSTQQLPPVANLTDNFRKPLSEYADRLFHETSIEGAGPFVARQISTEMGDVHLANTANLARGQGGKGVLIEFTPGTIEGQIGKKPGWQLAWENGEGEFRATHVRQREFQDNVVSVTIEKGAKGSRSRSAVLRNALKDWDETVNPDGSTTFTKPGVTTTTAGAAPTLDRPTQPANLGLTSRGVVRRDLPGEIAAAKVRTDAFKKGPTGVGGGTPPPPRSAAAEIPEGDPILQKVITAIKGAQRLGTSRRELVAEFRGRQFGRGMRAQEGRSVLERDVAFRRAQAGAEADLPDITKLQVEFGPGEFEGLVQRIYDSPRIRQGTYDPFTTANAFKKLFGPIGGKLPTPGELAMLERVFGREFVSAILSKRGLGTKAWDEFLQAWNLPRAFMATADLSASLRQAAPLGVNNRLRYKDAFREQLKAFISEKSAQEAQDVLERHPRFNDYTRKKGIEDPRKGQRLQLTTFDRSANFTRREESFMSRWSQNIPIVRNAERAYVTMLNQLRFNVMDDMVKQSEKQLGRVLNEQELDHIASFINYATGRGPLGPAEAAAPFLNGMFFAPRFATSRFALPARAVSETIQAVTPTRVAGAVSEATGGAISATNRTASRKMAVDLAAYVATGVAVLKMLELGIDKVGGEAEVNANPQSSDFGKLRLGKTRIDLWAGFTQVARLVAQLYTGEGTITTTGESFPLSSEFIFGRGNLENVEIKQQLPSRGVALGRFVRGKLSPVAGEITDQLTGTDFLGDESTPGRFTELSRKNPFFENLVPLFVQDVVDAVMEEGGISGLKAIPSFFGAGATTYTSDLDRAAEQIRDGARFIELSEQEQDQARSITRKARESERREKLKANQP